MIQLLEWFQHNSSDLLFAITSLVTATSIIVNLTPTLKDDSFWLPIVKFLSKFVALNRTVNDEEIRGQ